MVKKLINFNGKMKFVYGTIIGVVRESYAVQFKNNGVTFRGMWNKNECTKI